MYVLKVEEVYILIFIFVPYIQTLIPSFIVASVNENWGGENEARRYTTGYSIYI